MLYRILIAATLAFGLSSCESQGEPSSVTFLCKPVSMEHGNRLFYAMVGIAEKYEYELVVNREEIELGGVKRPLPQNRELINGVLKDNGLRIASFSSNELAKNGYAIAFYDRADRGFRDDVLLTVSGAIESTESLEFVGNAYHGRGCEEGEISE